MDLQLSVPDMKFFPSYLTALEEGFAYGSGDPFTADEIAEIKADPEKHIAEMRITLKDGVFTAKDGSTWPRVPQERIWITKGDQFVGAINFRPNIHEMLKGFGGHAGYSITPSARRNGYMTKALGLLLNDKDRMQQVDRDYLIVTTGDDNEPSKKTILSNGGKLIGDFFSKFMQRQTHVYHIPLKR